MQPSERLTEARILIVEDQPSDVRLLVRILERDGIFKGAGMLRGSFMTAPKGESSLISAIGGAGWTITKPSRHDAKVRRLA